MRLGAHYKYCRILVISIDGAIIFFVAVLFIIMVANEMNKNSSFKFSLSSYGFLWCTISKFYFNLASGDVAHILLHATSQIWAILF